MKKNRWILAVAAMLSITLLAGCGNAEKTPDVPSEVSKEEYLCPMKCTEEVFTKPGSCPVCGMDLEKTAKS